MGRVGDDDLAAVRKRPQPRAPDDGGSGVVAFEFAPARTWDPFAAELGLARVQRHADAERSITRPHFVRQCPLDVERRRECIGRAGEHGHDAVAFTLLQWPRTAVQHNRRVEQFVVSADRQRRSIAIGFPHRRGSLDVTEQEGDGSGLELRLGSESVLVHGSEVCQVVARRHTAILRSPKPFYICHMAYPGPWHDSDRPQNAGWAPTSARMRIVVRVLVGALRGGEHGRMIEEEARRRIAAARVGRLASVDANVRRTSCRSVSRFPVIKWCRSSTGSRSGRCSCGDWRTCVGPQMFS